jgi:Family of unknown function (DUF6544)
MPRSFDRIHRDAVAAELARQPLREATILADSDLARLPAPVRRYIVASGAVGHPIPQNVRFEFDALMRRKPGDAGMRSRSVQLNVFGRPARLFIMRARMFGLPVRALHLYREEQATFQVRVASLVNMVDVSGPELSAAETVTVLNDLVLMAPGALVDDRLAWRPIDDWSAEVTFRNGPHCVAALLEFNDRDELVDFWSDDRPDVASGRAVPMRWRTPISGYREVAGLRLPSGGLAVYERPDGPFTYGEFTLRSLAYDIGMPAAG